MLGAGKTTTALWLLPHLFTCQEYINADHIAAGLSPLQPASKAITAGKIMVQQIHALLQQRHSFAIETTLSSQMVLKVINQAQQYGYQIHLLFLYLPDVRLAQQRVAQRVAAGGHDIDPAVIVRRYRRGLHNFHVYHHHCHHWSVWNNTTTPPQLMAYQQNGATHIIHPTLWQRFSQETAS